MNKWSLIVFVCLMGFSAQAREFCGRTVSAKTEENGAHTIFVILKAEDGKTKKYYKAEGVQKTQTELLKISLNNPELIVCVEHVEGLGIKRIPARFKDVTLKYPD